MLVLESNLNLTPIQAWLKLKGEVQSHKTLATNFLEFPITEYCTYCKKKMILYHVSDVISNEIYTISHAHT